MRHPPPPNLSKLYQAFLVFPAKNNRSGSIVLCVPARCQRQELGCNLLALQEKLASENQPGPQVDSIMALWDSAHPPTARQHRFTAWQCQVEEGCSHPREGTTKP